MFLIFLPPLLYDAAFNISFREFRTHIKTISILAIGLVFLTTMGIAIFCHLVIAGMSLAISRFSNQVFPEHLKLQSKSFWDVIIFLLNGLIFILIGLEFPYVLHNIQKAQVFPLLGYAFLITLLALALRMARVFLRKLNLQRSFKNQIDRISEDELLDSKTSIIVSWAGMRGIISLAIALGLPFFLDDGQLFPQRNTIIFISVAVVLFTLLGQGPTLPLIIKKFNK